MSSERPILFSGEMVRAILEGKKTQTRRVVKPQPPDWIKEFGYTAFTPKGHISGRGYWKGVPGDEGPGEKFFKCPYGMTGMKLWVRESYFPNYYYSDEPDSNLTAYKATWEFGDHNFVAPKWKPAIFMPRAYSRITLEIVNIRVERVQAISQADAKAEGADPWFACSDGMKEVENGVEFSIEHCPEEKRNYRKGYEFLWDAINAKRGHSWESNPWVWVIEFRAVQK